MKKSLSRNADNDSVRQRLHTYTLAASAAGVSMLALAAPGEAEIIYTPANTQIGLNQTVSLDLNGDGIADFNFSDYWRTNTGQYIGGIRVATAQLGNGIMVSPGGYASALRLGALIGSAAKFSSGNPLMAWGFFDFSWPFKKGCLGPWKNKRNHYLGLMFIISGQLHYGWARLTETCRQGQNTAVLTGYAYETITNQGLKAGQKKGTIEDESMTEPTPSGIPAPKPATLGMLSKGAPALNLWRRE